MYKTLVTLILVAAVVLGIYAFISNPDKVVVNESGRVDGLMNKVRSLVQGERFWHLQLKIATDEFKKIDTPQLPSSSEMQALYKKLREDQAALDEKMKPLYTPEEREANLLRTKADSLERSGKWRVIDDAAEAARARELERIKIIIPLIESKLNVSKQ